MSKNATDTGARGPDTAAYPLAVASAAAVVISNSSGLAISDDGVAYRAVADSINADGILGYFLEPRLTTWPPLWPRLLAFVERATPLDIEGAAIALNAIFAAVVVVLFAAAIRPLVHSSVRRIAAVAAVALGATQILFGHILNTDYSSTVIFLALFLAAGAYRRSPDLRFLVIAALIVWAGFGVRYASLAAIPLVAVWIPLSSDRPLPRRLGHAAFFTVAAAAFPLGVMIRNHSVDGTYLGSRSPSARGVAGNTFDAVASVGNFLAPGVSVDLRAVWAGVAVLGSLLALLATARVLVRTSAASSLRRARRTLATPLGLAVIWAVGFGVYLVAARSTTAFDRLNFRLLHPLWAPLVVLGVVVADRLCDPRVESDRRWRALGATLLWGWVGVSLTLGLVMVGWFATGPDLFPGNYERDAFVAVRSSPLLDEIPQDCVVHSNLPSALYPEVEAAWTPRERIPESTEELDELDELSGVVAGEYCVAWVDLDPSFGNLAELDDIADRAELVELGTDGALSVYRLEPI